MNFESHGRMSRFGRRVMLWRVHSLSKLKLRIRYRRTVLKVISPYLAHTWWRDHSRRTSNCTWRSCIPDIARTSTLLGTSCAPRCLPPWAPSSWPVLRPGCSRERERAQWWLNNVWHQAWGLASLTPGLRWCRWNHQRKSLQGERCVVRFSRATKLIIFLSFVTINIYPSYR